jgi:hypothetical protein
MSIKIEKATTNVIKIFHRLDRFLLDFGTKIL